MGVSANILIVEDDRPLATMLATILSGDGYAVEQVHSGDRAVRQALQSPPDLILLDVLLPGMNGYDVLRYLRAEPKTMHVPVIMLTALQEVADKLRAFDLHVNDYLTKPFNNDELLARIRAHLYHTYSTLLSPLTGLPGSTQVERAIERCFATDVPWALLYLDLDHFKALNDGYGFLRGNDMIRLFMHAVVGSVSEFGAPQDFVGHIGGEDFVVLTTPERVHVLCQSIISHFSQAVQHFYRQDDLERGKFWAIGRKGVKEWFPLVTISIAVVLSGRMPRQSPSTS